MRTVPCVAVSLMLGACAAFSAETDADKPAGALDAGGAGEAGSNGDAAAGLPDSALDDGASLDSGGAAPALINCFGTQRAAFYCDGFESPTLATPPWTLIASSSDTSVAEFATSANQYFMGARSAASYVGLSGAVKTAKAHWERPAGPGPLALQLRVFVPSGTTWGNGEATTIAALVGSSSRVDLVFTANGTSSNGMLSLKTTSAAPGGTGSSSQDIGAVTVDAWMCVEITADGTSVTAKKPPSTSVSVGNTIRPTAAELGISTTVTGVTFYYDNVILAPAAIGCP